ncbi:MAG: hypothetical protein ACYDB8_06605 [Acidiferrobacterales bacterium]
MRISATRLQTDLPAPGIRGSTSGALQNYMVSAPSDTSGRRHNGEATPPFHLPAVRVMHGSLVEKIPNADTAWPAVRRSTALRGRIIPSPGAQPGDGAHARNAISAYAEISNAGSQALLLNRYA